MTTNIVDIESGQATSDSRWSMSGESHAFPGENFIIFIDNTGCEKIFRYKDTVFSFAGHGGLIQKWKKYLLGRCGDEPQYEQEVQGHFLRIDLCITHIKKGTVHRLPQDPAYYGLRTHFLGTGAIHARECWSVHKCPRLAVESAKKKDAYSGGIVKYLVFKNDESNICDSQTVDVVSQKLTTEGCVMYTNDPAGPCIPVQQAAERDPAVRAAVQSLQSGAAVAMAPCPGMYGRWSDEDKAELRRILDEVYAE